MPVPETAGLSLILREALQIAHEIVNELGEKGSTIIENPGHDITTQADMAIAQGLIEFFRGKGTPALLDSEELGRINLSNEPQYTIIFDELDGTDNYARAPRVLPHCTLISVYRGLRPNFRDGLATAIIEHNSGLTMEAQTASGCLANGKTVRVSGRKELDRRTLVAVDSYMSGAEISRLASIFRAGWVKDFGSSGLHLALLAAGGIDAYVTACQHGRELSAGHLLIQEAGGIVTDFDGRFLEDRVLDPSATYQTIATSSFALNKELVSLIGKGPE